MKDGKEKSRDLILAAGGIVLRNVLHNDLDFTPQFALVQSRKLGTWGLPKGKLAAGEDAITAARREVLEETGHRVTVHEFLGTLVYEASSRPKVVQFWRMEAAGEPTGALTRDVKAVCWLALDDAINRLFHLRERVFLEQVGPIALRLAERRPEAAPFQAGASGRIIVPGVPLAPGTDAFLLDDAGDIAVAERIAPPPFQHHFAGLPAPAVRARTADGLNEGPRVKQNPSEQGLVESVREADDKPVIAKIPGEKNQAGKALIKKTWGWLRQVALLHRQPRD